MANQVMAVEEHRSELSFAQGARRRKLDHRFYTVMAFAMAGGVFAGFARTYYAKSYFHTPEIPLWVHIHGAVFTAWIIFYLLQNLLAMNGGMKLHRKLGITGGVIATGVVLLGSAITVRQARGGNSFPFPDAYSLLAVSFAQMLLFGIFISLGLWLRRDSETHKRLILMSSQLFFFPAFGRLLHGINATTLSIAMCFYLAGPVYDLITRRRIHPAYRWGVPLLILTMPPFMVMLSQATLWHSIVARLIG